jgi:hypothetical protein
MSPPVTAPHDAGDGVAPAATLLVRGVFVLATRSLFVVRGSVASGAVRAGQRVLDPAGLDAIVLSVEERLLDVSGGAPQTALIFHYATRTELQRWKSLIAEGTMLSLAPGD